MNKLWNKMTNVLLISEDKIKENSNLNDNFFGKNLRTPIREAQDIGLQSIVGECLYKRILDLVSTGDIKLPENIAYKDLLDNYIQDYLLYMVLSNSVLTANVKMANMGSVLTNDEHLVNLSQAEAELLRKNYEDKADFYCKRLQAFLCQNYDAYPELKECECGCCYTIKPNLKSAVSSQIWLGGILYK